MVIPIVLAADDNYVPMLGVTIQSIIANASLEDEYCIYIFHTEMNKMYRKRLQYMRRNNVQIFFVDLNEKMLGIRREHSNHLSIETVYRLFIPEVLQEYDKVLYLDCDLVVNSNVAELYKTDMEGYVLGAAHDAFSKVAIEHIESVLKISYECAFNAGVLLINTKKFLEEKVKERCFALLNEDWDRQKRQFIYMDQDVLNIVCNGEVRFFSMEWDFQWGCMKYGGVEPVGAFANEYRQAQENYKIIHFSGGEKPWEYPELCGAQVYWHYARQSFFYEELLRRISPWEVYKKNLFKRLSFPFQIVKAKSNIVLYGAGFVGKVLKRQIDITRYCNVLLWADKNYEEIQKTKYLHVSSPLKIQEVEYDYLVIAVEEKNMADAIKGELLAAKIPKEKIVWTNYFK